LRHSLFSLKISTTYLAAGQRPYRSLVLVLLGDVQGCGLFFLRFGLIAAISVFVLWLWLLLFWIKG
jgi:hypothetical protein